MAVNQVFKIEKFFEAGELGCTDIAKAIAAPLLAKLELEPEFRRTARLPGMVGGTKTWLLSRNQLAEYDLR